MYVSVIKKSFDKIVKHLIKAKIKKIQPKCSQKYKFFYLGKGTIVHKKSAMIINQGLLQKKEIIS